MDNDTLIIALSIVAGVGTVMLSPALIVRMVLSHRERLIALKNRQEGAPGLVEEVRALRSEVAALRDTTTRCDMTFDAAIDRLEGRMERMEAERRAPSSTTSEEAAAYLRRG